MLLSASPSRGRSALRCQEGRAPLQMRGGSAVPGALPEGFLLSEGFFKVPFWFKCGFAGVWSIDRFHPGPFHGWDALSPPEGLLRRSRKIPFWAEFPLHPPTPPTLRGETQHQICLRAASSPKSDATRAPQTPFPFQGVGSPFPNPPRAQGWVPGSGAGGGLLPHPSPRQGLEIKVGFVGIN